MKKKWNQVKFSDKLEADLWKYGLYSASLMRFTREKVQVFRLDSMEWSDVTDPELYRRVIEDSDLLTFADAQEIYKTITKRK